MSREHQRTPLKNALIVVTALFIAPVMAKGAEWTSISTDLLAKEKAGYGGLTGIVIHPKSGDVFAFLSEKGLYRSIDQGSTWSRHGAGIIGRTEWPGCIDLYPGEKVDRFVIATVYGGPIVASGDGGETWKSMHRRSKHVDWCAVAPDDPETKFVLALKHEMGDMLIRSTDGGKTFQNVRKDFGPACVFDERTAVALSGPAGKRKFVRTTNAGETFEACADWNTRALPRWHSGKVYWLVDGAIVTTADKGATWKKVCDVKDGRFGPVFGKDEKHLLVLTSRGIIESRDGGANWSEAMPLPNKISSNSPLTWLGYDPHQDVLYVAQMGADLFRLKREK